jgi:hypothetical protein
VSTYMLGLEPAAVPVLLGLLDDEQRALVESKLPAPEPERADPEEGPDVPVGKSSMQLRPRPRAS